MAELRRDSRLLAEIPRARPHVILRIPAHHLRLRVALLLLLVNSIDINYKILVQMRVRLDEGALERLGRRVVL